MVESRGVRFSKALQHTDKNISAAGKSNFAADKQGLRRHLVLEEKNRVSLMPVQQKERSRESFFVWKRFWYC